MVQMKLKLEKITVKQAIKEILCNSKKPLALFEIEDILRKDYGIMAQVNSIRTRLQDIENDGEFILCSEFREEKNYKEYNII